MLFQNLPSKAQQWVIEEAGDITIWELFLAGLRPASTLDRVKVAWDATVESFVNEVYVEKFKTTKVKLDSNVARLLYGQCSQTELQRMYAVVSLVKLLRKYNPHWATLTKELFDALQVGGLVSNLATDCPAEYYGLLQQFHSEEQLHRMGQLDDAPHCFVFTVPRKYEGRVWSMATFLQMFYLPVEATEEMMDILHKVSPAAKGLHNFILGDTEMEVMFDVEEDIVTLNKGRISRTRYTLRATGGVDLVYFTSACHFLSWTMLQWVIQGIERSDVSHMINRDCTSLVAPNRVYGDPSPLNLSLDHNNVGHVEYGSCSETGVVAVLGRLWEDKEIYTIPQALNPVYEEGLAAIIQHQAMNLRVGSAAAAMGKSTIWMVLGGKLVQASISDFQVDKTTKTFNRDSLRTRCQPIVEILKESSTGLQGFESLLSQFRA